MKIAYVLQEGVPDPRQRPLPGPANHVYQVFKELQGLGHHVEALLRLDKQIYHSPDLEQYHPVHLPGVDDGRFRQFERVVRGLQARLRLPYANWFESYRFAKACQRYFSGYDLLYERMGWMGYGSGMAARWIGVPLVAEINNGDFITELERLGVAPQGIHRWLALRLMRRAAHRPAHIIASGAGHRQRFIAWWGVPPDKVTVVENGSEVVNLLARADLRCFQQTAFTPTPPCPITFVFVGAFEPWHGILKLIAAMASVLHAIPQARLVLIGGGTQEQEILRLIAAHNLQAHIQLTGKLNIQQVAQQLAQADIGVAPYCGWMEFSGLKLFDYKSAGLAIVASGADGQPPTLAHEKTALIVPPCDEQALSAAMIRLAQDAELRRRLGQQGRIEAEQVHSWRHTAVQIEQIFKDVLAKWM